MSIRDPTKDSYASVSSLRSGEFGRGTRGLAANDFSAALAMSNVELRHQIEIKLSEWKWTPASPPTHVFMERLVRRCLFRRPLEPGQLFFDAQQESRKREPPDRFVL